jgi:predicted AAA+ superfamily ATPase
MPLIFSEVSRDLAVAVNTIKRYLELLTMSFQCVLLPPWHENVSKRLVKCPKLYIPDVGLNRHSIFPLQNRRLNV